mmetsp:Transcript_21621/g.38368  ORF Transcript_21621/g.38368 Transcript_21621/m.38368 type:complete len:263 (+) Transcript_21621:78-866(+)
MQAKAALALLALCASAAWMETDGQVERPKHKVVPGKLSAKPKHDLADMSLVDMGLGSLMASLVKAGYTRLGDVCRADGRKKEEQLMSWGPNFMVQGCLNRCIGQGCKGFQVGFEADTTSMCILYFEPIESVVAYSEASGSDPKDGPAPQTPPGPGNPDAIQPPKRSLGCYASDYIGMPTSSPVIGPVAEAAKSIEMSKTAKMIIQDVNVIAALQEAEASQSLSELITRVDDALDVVVNVAGVQAAIDANTDLSASQQAYTMS